MKAGCRGRGGNSRNDAMRRVCEIESSGGSVSSSKMEEVSGDVSNITVRK